MFTPERVISYDFATTHAGGVEGGPIVATTNQRACVDCATPAASLPIVDERGTFEGWICHECDRRRRHRRISWYRRARRRLLG
jgi:hypothetical protein